MTGGVTAPFYFLPHYSNQKTTYDKRKQGYV